MGGWIFFILLGAHNPLNVRLRAHNEMANQLQQVHFFLEGRGMTLSPDFINTYELLAYWMGLSKPIPSEEIQTQNRRAFLDFERRWGMVDAEGEIKGFFRVPYRGLQVGVLGCAACHRGKAAGFYIPGLGNKNIDPAQVGRDAHRVLNLWKNLQFWKTKTPDYQLVETLSLDFAHRLSSVCRLGTSCGAHRRTIGGGRSTALESVNASMKKQSGIRPPTHNHNPLACFEEKSIRARSH